MNDGGVMSGSRVGFWGALPLLVTVLAGCSQPKRPNVLLVVIDTARADHFSCYGYQRETTPHIDALAADGVIYTEARSAAPWTLPSHASLFTGHWPGEHGLHWGSATAINRRDGEGKAVQPRQSGRLLAERMQGLGYRTVGITNNAWIAAKSGLDQGFETFIEYYKVNQEVREEYKSWPESLKMDLDLARLSAGMTVGLLKKTLTEQDDEPFFAFLNLMEPHFPYGARGGFRGCFGSDPILVQEMNDRKGDMERALIAGAETVETERLIDCYDEEIVAVDAAIGHLLDWMREQGLYEDTLILVTSDHGELLGEGGKYSHQLSMADELLRVPLVVKYPGNRDAGLHEPHPLVSNVDVYQTILAAASHGEAAADTRSRDLARIPKWDRGYIMAEYYCSPAYLEGLSNAFQGFDGTAHEGIRRVVFTGGGRLEFQDAEPLAGAPVPNALKTMMRRYADTVRELPIHYAEGVTLDPASLQQLEELGYVGDEDG